MNFSILNHKSLLTFIVCTGALWGAVGCIEETPLGAVNFVDASPGGPQDAPSEIDGAGPDAVAPKPDLAAIPKGEIDTGVAMVVDAGADGPMRIDTSQILIPPPSPDTRLVSMADMGTPQRTEVGMMPPLPAETSCRLQTSDPFLPSTPGAALDLVYQMPAADMPPSDPTGSLGYLTTDLGAAAAISENETTLFLCHNNVVAIDKATKKSTILAAREGCAFGISVANGRVFYLADATKQGGRSLKSVPTTGGPSRTIATGTDMITVLAKNDVVWWSERSGQTMLPRGPIWVANADGSGVRTIFDGDWGWSIRFFPLGDKFYFAFLGGALGGPGIKPIGSSTDQLHYGSAGSNVGVAFDGGNFFLVAGSDLVKVSLTKTSTTLGYVGDPGNNTFEDPKGPLFSRALALAGDRVILAHNENKGRAGSKILSFAKTGGSGNVVATCTRPLVDIVVTESDTYLVSVRPTVIWSMKR